MKRECSVEGCGDAHYCRGFCRFHYQRSRDGIPLDAPRRIHERHGLTRHPDYGLWATMIQRCVNPKAAKFHRYGGRGISVCERWRSSFAAFVRDMGPRPSPEHEIDRVNNDGNYEPGNCVWRPRTGQQRNRGNNRLTEALVAELREHVAAGGTATSWARAHGINPATCTDVISGRTWAGP